MTHHWDELSKTLAEPLPRRESLRRLGVVLTGAVLSPLGLDSAFAGNPDPCKAFCKCRNKRQQDQCLAACRACNKNTSRLCGSCGNYVCCGSGRTCCGGYCADLAADVLNCGACGFMCDPPGPYEFGACIDGECTYVCATGAVDCNGTCTFLGSDLANCGVCGHVCEPPGSNEFAACVDGRCEYGCYEGAVYCDGTCTFLVWDPNNCGACGNVCDESTPYCSYGVCIRGDEPCAPGLTRCNGVCTNPNFDTLNCGACSNVCAGGETCSGGVCQSPW